MYCLQKKLIMNIGVYFGKNIAFQNSAGGASTFCQSVLNAIKTCDTRHRFYLFFERIEEFEDDQQRSCVKFIKIDSGFGEPDEGFLKRQIFRIPRKIKRMNIQMRYATALNKAAIANQIDLMWFATPAFEFVSVPFIYTVWDLQHRVQSYFPEVSVTGWTFEKREQRYNFVIPRAAYVVTGNQAGKDEITKFYGIPDERVKINPLPVPQFVFSSNQNECEKASDFPEKFIFYPAQFWPHKNHIVILLALKLLQEKYSLKISAVFTGSDKGNLGYIKEVVKKMKMEEQIHFLGFVSIQKLISLYKKAFALVFPSFFGPDNIPPLEAFSLGCPVIAAKVDGASIQMGDAAMLFDPKNERELAESILGLHSDHLLRKELINRGFNLVQNYTSEKYVKRIIEIVDEFEPIRRCWSSTDVYKHL